jgi:hypothetical protein
MKAEIAYLKRPLFWTMSLLILWGALPQVAQAGGVSAITYVDAAGKRRIFAFAQGSNYQLVANYWVEGAAWQKADFGLPPGSTYLEKPNAITYIDAAGKRRIYVFAFAEYGLFGPTHLVVKYYVEGVGWQWSDQGWSGEIHPGRIAYPPKAVTYVDSEGKRRIYVFAQGYYHLMVNYYIEGVGWKWADLGAPADASSVRPMDAISYVDGDGDRRIYVFCGVWYSSTQTEVLFLKYWNGQSWNWHYAGVANDDPQDVAAITYVDDNQHRRIYAFTDLFGNLWAYYWIQSVGWQWGDLGAPGGGSGRPQTAITYVDSDGTRRIHVFAHKSSGGHLYRQRWTGSSWEWADHGDPPVGNLRNIDAVTYVDDKGNRHIYVFCESLDAAGRHLAVNYWVSGTTLTSTSSPVGGWKWVNLGYLGPL